MYASKAVEYASAPELYAEPAHPYTHGLFNSRPSLHMSKDEALKVIPGAVPNPLRFPTGCKFHPRCPLVVNRCKRVEPLLRDLRGGHLVACDVV